MFYPTDPSEKTSIFALRLGKYKAHFYTRGMYVSWLRQETRLTAKQPEWSNLQGLFFPRGKVLELNPNCLGLNLGVLDLPKHIQQ